MYQSAVVSVNSNDANVRTRQWNERIIAKQQRCYFHFLHTMINQWWPFGEMKRPAAYFCIFIYCLKYYKALLSAGSPFCEILTKGPRGRTGPCDPEQLNICNIIVTVYLRSGYSKLLPGKAYVISQILRICESNDDRVIFQRWCNVSELFSRSFVCDVMSLSRMNGRAF